MIHKIHRAQISQLQDGCNMCVIMKKMCPASYHHNGFSTTRVFGQMMYDYTLLVI